MPKLIGDDSLIFYASFAAITSSMLAVLILWDILRLTPGKQWRLLFSKRQHGHFRIFMVAELSGHILFGPVAVTWAHIFNRVEGMFREYSRNWAFRGDLLRKPIPAAIIDLETHRPPPCPTGKVPMREHGRLLFHELASGR